MPTTQNTSRQYMTSLSILFYALLAGQLIFLGIAAVLKFVADFPNIPELDEILLYLPIVVLAGGFMVGSKLYNSRLVQLREMNQLPDQLNGYRGASILRWALAEGPIVLTIMSYLLTGKALLLGLAAGAIIAFITLRPGKEKLIRELALSSDAAAELN